MMISAMFLAAVLAPAPLPPVEAEEIVVTANRRRKCEVRFAERILSKREFNARAREWARGTPVRIVTPRGADRQCLVKIAFRLGEQGVRLIHFVDRPDAP